MAWQREGFAMFGKLMDGIDDDYLRYVFHVQVVSQPAEEPDLAQASYQAAEDPLEGPSLLDVFRATAAERASLGDGNRFPSVSARAPPATVPVTRHREQSGLPGPRDLRVR